MGIREKRRVGVILDSGTLLRRGWEGEADGAGKEKKAHKSHRKALPNSPKHEARGARSGRGCAYS